MHASAEKSFQFQGDVARWRSAAVRIVQLYAAIYTHPEYISCQTDIFLLYSKDSYSSCEGFKLFLERVS